MEIDRVVVAMNRVGQAERHAVEHLIRWRKRARRMHWWQVSKPKYTAGDAERVWQIVARVKARAYVTCMSSGGGSPLRVISFRSQ